MRRDRKGSEGDEIKEKEKKKEIQKDEKKLTPAEHVFARFIPSLIIELKNYENQFQEEKRKLTNGLKRLQSLKDLKLKTKASDKGEPIFSDPAKTEKHYKTILEELTKQNITP